MKVFLLLLIINKITQTISKSLLNTDFDKNGITINDIYIKYNNYYETNINNISDIQFDTINSDNNDNYTLGYTELITPLIKAVQELTIKNKELSDQNNELFEQNKELFEKYNELFELNKELFKKFNELIKYTNNNIF